MHRVSAPRLFSERAFVAGEWISATDGRAVAVINPSTQLELGRIPRLGPAETQCATVGAEAAFPAGADAPRTSAEKFFALGPTSCTGTARTSPGS